MHNSTYLVLVLFYFLKVCQTISLYDLADRRHPTDPELLFDRSKEPSSHQTNKYGRLSERGPLSEKPAALSVERSYKEHNSGNDFKGINKIANEVLFPSNNLIDSPIASEEDLFLVSPIQPTEADPGETASISPEESTSASGELSSSAIFPTENDFLLLNLSNSSKIREYETASGVLLRFIDFPEDSDDEVSVISEETDLDSPDENLIY